MTYDWLAALVFVGSLIAMTTVGRFLVFRIPALQRMRELNEGADQEKMARKRFREAVKVNTRAGLRTNLVFYVAVLPFCVSLEPRPLWRHAVDIVFEFFVAVGISTDEGLVFALVLVIRVVRVMPLHVPVPVPVLAAREPLQVYGLIDCIILDGLLLFDELLLVCLLLAPLLDRP